MLIQSQQARENFIIRQTCFPTIGCEDGFIEFPVGEVEPSGTFVVEISERALGEQLCLVVVLRNETRITNSADASLVRLANITRPWTINRAREFQNLITRPLRRIDPHTAKGISFDVLIGG